MDFELSKYQKQILNEFQNSNDNLFISALAGASKTFMLTEISKLIKLDSFPKSTLDEFNKYGVTIDYDK